MDDAQKYNGNIDVSKRTQRIFTSNSLSKPEIGESPGELKSIVDDKTRGQDSSVENLTSAMQAADIDNLGPKSELQPVRDSVTPKSSATEERTFPEMETLREQVSKVRLVFLLLKFIEFWDNCIQVFLYILLQNQTRKSI